MTTVAVPSDLDAAWHERIAQAKLGLDLAPYPKAQAPDAVLLGLGDGRVLNDLLDRWPTVRWVHTVSTGVETLVGSLRRHPGVVLTNSAGAIALPMAEFALACMLASAKSLPRLFENQRAAVWRRDGLGIRQVAGRTVVVVGLGEVGRRVAALSHMVGMRVLAITARPERIQIEGVAQWGTDHLDAALSDADFIVLAAALTEQTRGMFGNAQLRSVRQGAVLVNIARCGLLDMRAVVESLMSGRLAEAWLDVFDTEPLPADDPLWSLQGVHVSPHVSSFAAENSRRLADIFLENARRFVAGEALDHVVDPGRGY
jgi:phosphoglycerate dehydrogenase-like enzyme